MILSILAWSILFAGQSIQLTPSTAASTVVDPLLAANQSWRIEFQLHDWELPTAGNEYAYVFRLRGVGVSAIIQPDGDISMGSWRDTGDGGVNCSVSLAGRTNVLVRFQRNYSTGVIDCEVWNSDGTDYAHDDDTFTVNESYSDSNGFLGGPDDGGSKDALTVSLAFLRVATTLVALNSTPPTTANAGDWTELKFDGDLLDSTANNHDVTLEGDTYETTADQVPVAIMKTSDAPVWGNWASMRAGYPTQLSCTDSFSLADDDDDVTCKWQLVSGPTITWDSHTSDTPTVASSERGTYRFRLVVTDASGATATTEMDIGAVATDDNGVVVAGDAAIDKVFGPLIAFGRNPWGFADERALAAMELRKADYEALDANGYSLAAPSWRSNGAGTISYVFSGVGGGVGATGTTLAAGIDADDLEITVPDASKLDLSGLPTTPVRILVGGGWNNGGAEEVRICAADGNTLTVCYDGRGSGAGIGGLVAAKTHSAGATVGQYRVNGTSSLFLTDTAVPLCPNGVGPMGSTYYSTGTITLTAGSATVEGSGTTWTSAMVGKQLRVEATTSSTPFTFFALVSSVTDADTLVVNRAFPTDADTDSYSYKLLSLRYPVVHYQRASSVDTTTDGMVWRYGTACESETAWYGMAYLDYTGYQPTLGPSTQSGKHWSYIDAFEAQSAYGPNFYGEGLAHRALYLRSGLTDALTAANEMDENWAKGPEIDGGYAGGMDLLTGGGAIGAIADLVTNPDTALAWTDVYGFVLQAYPRLDDGCHKYDSRGQGYTLAWLALAALFDTNETNRATWKTQLASAYTLTESCKGTAPSNPVETNSWAGGGARWNSYGTASDMTADSATVTAHSGSTFSSSLCHGTSTASVTMTNGSASFTGTGLVDGGKIVISGTKDSAPYTGFFQFIQSGGTSGSLSALWPGDSGTFDAMIADSTTGYDFNLVISKADETAYTNGSSDESMRSNWECIYDSSTQITLNRPWSYSTGVYYPARSTVVGYGQQPYMLGIQTQYMRWASLIDDEEAEDFGVLAAAAAQWLKDYGYDSNNKGLHYGRVFPACEPGTTSAGNFFYRQPFCSYGGTDAGGGLSWARPLNGEIGAALGVLYDASPTEANKAWGDTVYGAVWGKPEWTTGGVYSDEYYVTGETSDASLGSYKQTGFFFGMGMAHQWPAARLGGVAAAENVTAYVGFSLAAVPNAASASLTVTNPAGTSTVIPCAASPCEATVDRRQGDHVMVLRYLSAGGATLAQSDVMAIRAR